jgi:hypothetical protein
VIGCTISMIHIFLCFYCVMCEPCTVYTVCDGHMTFPSLWNIFTWVGRSGQDQTGLLGNNILDKIQTRMFLLSSLHLLLDNVLGQNQKEILICKSADMSASLNETFYGGLFLKLIIDCQLNNMVQTPSMERYSIILIIFAAVSVVTTPTSSLIPH